MKKILFNVTIMAVAAAGIAACSDDDSPVLRETIAPVLSDLAADTIAANETNDAYTFNWTQARFRLDSNVGTTSIGSFENQGINYDVQVDFAGGDFAARASVGQVVSGLYLTVSHDDVTKALKLSLALDDSEEKADLIFRVVAKYSSVDSLELISNVISCAWKKAPPKPVEGPTPHFYICDNAGWGAMALYAWNETGNMLPWPGVTPSGFKELNGKTYYDFDMPSDYINRAGLNFIANNNGAGQQMDIMQNYTFSSDVYVTVNADGTYTIDAKPLPTLYLCSETGWNDYWFYVWAGSGDVKDGWPGVQYSSVTQIGGETWYIFEMAEEYYNTRGGNWIINNNGGSQYDLMQNYDFTGDVFVRLAADGTYTVSAGPVVASDGFTVYANIDNTDWEGVSMYNWGGPGELAGGWPGAATTGPIFIDGKSWFYHTFHTTEDINVILNNNGGGQQCADISGHADVFVTVNANLSYTLQYNLFE